MKTSGQTTHHITGVVSGIRQTINKKKIINVSKNVSTISRSPAIIPIPSFHTFALYASQILHVYLQINRCVYDISLRIKPKIQ